MIVIPQLIPSKLKLVKITNRGATGNLFAVDNEVLFVDWNNGSNHGLYAIDRKLRMRQIDKTYFATKTIGAHYPIIEEQLPLGIENYLTSKGLYGQVYFSYYQEDKVYGFDRTGKKMFEWTNNISRGHALHDIKFQPPHFLWLAFPTGQTVVKLSLVNKREVFRIGDYSWGHNESEVLSYPESLWVRDNFLYIPNMGNHKIYKLDLHTYHLSEEIILDEQPWQYLKCNTGTFVVTETGIYAVME